jgi:integrase
VKIHVRKRGETYHLDISIRGVRYRESLETGDQRVAKMRAEIRSEEIRSSKLPPRSAKMSEFIAQYKLYLKPRMQATSYANVEKVIDDFATDVHVTYLDQVEQFHADQHLSSLARRLKPRTVNNHRMQLRAMFQRAIEWELLLKNPFALVKPLPVEQARIRIIKRGELVLYFQTLRIQAPVLMPLVLFYLATGMRRSEALKLQWSDVDFEESMIAILGKGGRRRTIPLNSIARAILENRRDQERPFAFDKEVVTSEFKRVALKCGLSDIRLHDLRKTHGTLLAKIGINGNLIQKWLGWSSAEVANTYYIGLPEGMEEKLKELEALIDPSARSENVPGA